MRHLGIVASSAPQASAPTITINSTTNFNQERATFNATVVPNGATTSVKFQYSTNESTWTDSGTVSGLTGTSQSVYFNHSSPALSANTLYYIRAVATNSAGSSTSSNTTFTTWALKTYTKTTVGAESISIPTITPTDSSIVIPSIYNAFVIGGGAGGGSTTQSGIFAGGGGAVTSVSSRSFNNASSLSLSITVGAGGSAAVFDTTEPTVGGNSSITGDSFTSITATRGAIYSGTTGGSSGNGNAGGAWVQYLCTGEKCLTSATAAGGGGGSSSVGAAGSVSPANDTGKPTGGKGGNGTYSSIYEVGGGAGGGGGAFDFNETVAAGGSKGDYSTYGAGGNGAVQDGLTTLTNPTAGGSGYAAFQYYGPP